jgi:hypothetical protein
VYKDDNKEVAYVAECLITTQRDSKGQQQYQKKIGNLLGRHQQVFGSIPLGRPPDKGFEYTIELEGAKPMITPPYRHPRRFKDEIEKEIKELLAMGHIRPSISPFTSSVVLVLKKDVHRLLGFEQENHQEPGSYPSHR